MCSQKLKLYYIDFKTGESCMRGNKRLRPISYPIYSLTECAECGQNDDFCYSYIVEQTTYGIKIAIYRWPSPVAVSLVKFLNRPVIELAALYMRAQYKLYK